MRLAARGLCTVAFLAAVMAAIWLVVEGPIDVALFAPGGPLSLNFGVYFDSLAGVMLLLTSFIGMVIARFSARYLERESTEGRFLKWMSLTLGAVLMLVVSRNLVMFTAAWMLTSFGLHQLLTHYKERPWALWAARKKFIISRLGDLMLLAGLAAVFMSFGSFDYGEVFAEARLLQQKTGDGSFLVPLIGTLLVLGAMTKSAQFPFHSWLPDTMEAPTPVSALMHAGIINAGGFLVIRMSPLISLSPISLGVLAAVGSFTALFAGIVMLTQTSIKRSLAFSTIAQMGFMMLQCGLGGFSAALLHIVAHSLYKAHAFLASGSVIAAAARRRSGRPIEIHGMPGLLGLAPAVAAAIALVAAGATAVGITLTEKPGGLVLAMVMTVAITHLVWHALASGSWRLAGLGLVGGGIVSICYFLAFTGTDRLLTASASHQLVAETPLGMAVSIFVTLGFLGVFVLQSAAEIFAGVPWIRSLHVHASNGFYFDIPARRLTARIYGHSVAVP